MSRHRSCYGPTSTFRLRVDGRLYNRIPHTCRLGVLSGMTFLNPLLWASPSQIWQLWIAVLTATKIGSTLGWSTNRASTFVWVTLSTLYRPWNGHANFQAFPVKVEGMWIMTRLLTWNRCSLACLSCCCFWLDCAVWILRANNHALDKLEVQLDSLMSSQCKENWAGKG